MQGARTRDLLNRDVGSVHKGWLGHSVTEYNSVFFLVTGVVDDMYSELKIMYTCV